MKILFVEDDRSISEMVSEYLASEEYNVVPVYDGSQAVELFNESRYDLVLVDLMLPGKSGMEVIKEIRKQSVIPIIIVTSKDDDATKTMGLNLGADDYVTKPFSLIELSSRIKANIRRAVIYSGNEEIADEIIQIQDLSINVTRHSVKRDGKELSLTYTEFEILKLLAAHPGQAFSKERIYDLVWKDPYLGNENVLNTHMNRLRAKLMTDKETDHKTEHPYIKTLWGIGYKMEES